MTVTTGAETRILDAAKACCERFGIAKASVDDIAAEARVSRATLYRMYPGGKDVVLDALRVRELEEFFGQLKIAVAGASTMEDLLVGTVVAATIELRNDQHLAIMLMSEPGDTLSHLTVQGMPRIIRMASLFLAPLVDPYLDRVQGDRLVDVLARLVISYFLAPSDDIDLGDESSARSFIRTHILPAFQNSASSSSPSSSSAS
ncbi:MAG: helix-turn-helix domain-containing protein [Ilumatobacteraceae bacterium]